MSEQIGCKVDRRLSEVRIGFSVAEMGVTEHLDHKHVSIYQALAMSIKDVVSSI